MQPHIGVLLINLGTPLSFQEKDVFRYLIEFLTDPRVIDFNWLKRQLLVRGIIVPKRYKQTAHAYQHIWTENGSPLIVYGKQCQTELSSLLGSDYCIELAMRYQQPSIKEGLDRLIKQGVKQLIILPLFPQYASATTGSVFQAVMEHLCHYQWLPQLTFINDYATDPLMIKAFGVLGNQFDISSYDHILFSFHGLPERQVQSSHPDCLTDSHCCEEKRANFSCYKAQCHATAHAIVKELSIPSEKFSICFQSRLGKEPWLQPYTNEMIGNLAKRKKKNVLIFCPSFVCDCLETIYEIGYEYKKEFLHLGGEKLDLVPGLNSHSLWIQALSSMITSHVSQKSINAL